MKRSLVFVILILFQYSVASAKENKDLMRANYYYSHFAYFEAIPCFEKVAGTLNDPDVYSQLGDCYSFTGNLSKAAEAYAKAVGMKGCKSTVILHYAELLMQLQQYNDAEKELTEYQARNKNDKRVANLLAGCANAKNIIQAIPPGRATFLPFNTDGSDFAPTLWKGKLVFASDTVIDLKKKTDYGTGKAYYNIYSVPCDGRGQCDTGFTKLSESKNVNIKYHNGPCTFSGDGKLMYYTRSRFNDNFFSKKSVSNKDSVVLLEIMIASDFDTANKRFQTITPFEYNSEDYSVAHPAVSPNGKVLVFSSNMPKGAGGSDLYICKKMNGGWSKPQNVGNGVNTEGEEVFPCWGDDATLFFSSDGHKGLGGLDIYKCNWDEKTNTFSAPENIGPPINSSYDDISLALFADGRSTYFSSNRPAPKGGDNIYFYKKEKIFLQLNVVDSLTLQPLTAVKISLESSNDKKNTMADNNGVYFTQLYPGVQYTANVSKEEYGSRLLVVDATSQKEIDTIYKTIKLFKPLPPPHDTIARIEPQPIVAKNRNVMDTPGIQRFYLGEVYEVGHFYYEYNKFNLTEVHKVFMDTLMAQLNRHPTMHIEIRAHTDCRGSFEYNQALSTNRALSVYNFLIEHGIARSRLSYKGLGFTDPAIKCPDCSMCTEQQHYLNRLLEFKVLEL